MRMDYHQASMKLAWQIYHSGTGSQTRLWRGNNSVMPSRRMAPVSSVCLGASYLRLDKDKLFGAFRTQEIKVATGVGLQHMVNVEARIAA
jgi:hypothetical protein